MTHKLPAKATEYIKDHFTGTFLCNVKSVRDPDGHLFYNVEVSKDNVITKLRFNEHGAIMNRSAEEAFPEDDQPLPE
jgi:hypothetical protein